MYKLDKGLSEEIGARAVVASWDLERRREIEAHGFIIESGDGQFYVMRRDFHNGALGWNGRPLIQQ